MGACWCSRAAATRCSSSCGFLNAPGGYADLLGPLAADGTTVVVEQLYARGPAVLTGRFTVRDEAAAAVAVVRRETAARPPPRW